MNVSKIHNFSAGPCTGATTAIHLTTTSWSSQWKVFLGSGLVSTFVFLCSSALQPAFLSPDKGPDSSRLGTPPPRTAVAVLPAIAAVCREEGSVYRAGARCLNKLEGVISRAQ